VPTVTIVGYSDVVQVSTGGRLVDPTLMLTGVSLIRFYAGALGAGSWQPPWQLGGGSVEARVIFGASKGLQAGLFA
jgi:hypothetical protein